MYVLDGLGDGRHWKRKEGGWGLEHLKGIKAGGPDSGSGSGSSSNGSGRLRDADSDMRNLRNVLLGRGR